MLPLESIILVLLNATRLLLIALFATLAMQRASARSRHVACSGGHARSHKRPHRRSHLFHPSLIGPALCWRGSTEAPDPWRWPYVVLDESKRRAMVPSLRLCCPARLGVGLRLRQPGVTQFFSRSTGTFLPRAQTRDTERPRQCEAHFIPAGCGLQRRRRCDSV